MFQVSDGHLSAGDEIGADMTLRCLSLGAGVQSTTMALMAARVELTPMPDIAIFADTGWEPAAVYDHLDWLRSGEVLPFPVEIVKKSNLRDDLKAGAANIKFRHAAVPFFTHERLAAGSRAPVLDADDKVVGDRVLTKDKDSFGIARRQCTREYKIEPISRHLRKLLGKGPRDRVLAGSVEM